MQRTEGFRCGAVGGCAFRHLILSLLFSFPLLIPPVYAGQSALPASSLPLLTRAEQIRNLTIEEANRGYPVRVRAVITFFDLETKDLFIQDSTAGVWVDLGDTSPALKAGQLLEVEGVTSAPDFAPQIAKPRFHVLGTAPLPVALPVTYSRMASTKEDSQWVEVEGIVHSAEKSGKALLLDVAADAGRVEVRISNFAEPAPPPLVDSKVRIDGACGAIFNQKNQIMGVALYSPSLSQVHTLEQAAANPFLTPLQPIAALLRFNPLGSSGHRVRVKGTVTLQQLGSSLFISDEGRSLYVHTRQATPVQVGDSVEAVGFPAAGEYSAVLQDSVFRRVSSGPLPSPTAVTAAQATDGSHDAAFVSITATLLEKNLGHHPHTLNMEAGNTVFQALLDDALPVKDLEDLAPGSLLRLNGVCTVHADENHVPQSFQILIRSLDGVALLKPPPWWSIKHLVMTISLLVAIVLGFIVWTTGLNRQVREKTMVIREGLRRETASRERYQELFENASDMVFTCDMEGHFISMNKAGRGMLQIGSGEALQTNLAEILAPEYSALARKILRETSQEGQRTCEVEILTKDRPRLYLELGTRLIRRNEQAVEIQGIGRDISQRRMLEEQLRQAQKMEAVGRLAGGVAHDFNNLLTVISGFGQLVLGRLDPGDSKHHHMTEVVNAADRAAGLTRQLLAFSRQQILEPAVLDLNVAIANTATMLRRMLGEDIELTIVAGEDLGRVKADPGEIDRAILNMAVNARDAMPQGGKLTLRTENISLDALYSRTHYSVPPGEYVLLSVSDTGCGIDPETQKHIFEPFFTTKEPGKGTGLGLAAVHGIISQSGGHVRVYSQPGMGTCFKIYLPRVDAWAKPIQSAPVREEHQRGSETILLVEDEAMVRALALEVLKEAGYTVIPAERPDEALKISDQNQGLIDLLLTDVVMPGMNGPELADRLKLTRPEIKVLYVSGYAADALLRHGPSHSKTAFLQKPFAPNALVRKVREALTVEAEPPKP